jgi:prepilin peptidase CpaA
MTNIILTLAILATLALAVRQDFAEHRVSNTLTFSAMAIAIGIQALAFGMDGALYALAGAGVGLLCLMPLYFVKGMGAGDVKLMGAAGSFIGPSHALVAAMLSLAVGALLAIGIIVWRVVERRDTTVAAGSAGEAPRSDLRTTLFQAGKQRFPYAIAIAAGVVLAMWMRGLLGPVLWSTS